MQYKFKYNYIPTAYMIANIQILSHISKHYTLFHLAIKLISLTPFEFSLSCFAMFNIFNIHIHTLCNNKV